MTSTDAAFVMPQAVTWRVIRWEATDDRRWKVAAYSDHPGGNWPAAMAVARAWCAPLCDDIEAGLARIQVEPVGAP